MLLRKVVGHEIPKVELIIVSCEGGAVAEWSKALL